MDFGKRIFGFFTRNTTTSQQQQATQAQTAPASNSTLKPNVTNCSPVALGSLGNTIFSFFASSKEFKTSTAEAGEKEAVANRNEQQLAAGGIPATAQCRPPRPSASEGFRKWRAADIDVFRTVVMNELKTGMKLTVDEMMHKLGLQGSVHNRAVRKRVISKLNNVRYAASHGQNLEQYGKQRRSHRNNGVNHRQLAVEALLALPGQQGTILDICNAIWAKQQYRHLLDQSQDVNHKSGPRWQHNITVALNRHPAVRVVGNCAPEGIKKHTGKLRVYNIETGMLNGK